MLKRAFTWSFRFLLDTKQIFDRRAVAFKSSSEKWAVFRAYAKIQWHRAFARYGDTASHKEISFLGYRVEFFNYDDLWLTFREIFILQYYHFVSETEMPFIVDCGSNIGMSILYFKKIYPLATIIGFEPEPRTFETLKRNIRNNIKDAVSVTLVNAAVSDREGVSSFFTSGGTVGHLGNSLVMVQSSDVASISVPCAQLSRYLTRPVDFLKLDIEGAEYAVVREIAEKWRLVKRSLIEYHYQPKFTENSLERILAVLTAHHFAYIVGQSIVDIYPSYHAIEGESYVVMVYAYADDGERKRD